MIAIKTIESSNIRGRFVTLYADTRNEIPITGEATAALIPEGVDLNVGDVIYTGKLEVAVLGSDGKWNWGD